jgi:hypothetical protein
MTPTCWACGSPWFEPDQFGVLRCCDCDADFSDKPDSRRVSADEPQSVRRYDGTPFEGKLDSCRQCVMPDRADLHAPYHRKHRDQRVICWYECHNGHQWSRSFVEAARLATVKRTPVPEVAGVYFIRGGDRIKIGMSGNARQRFDALRTSSPVELEFLGLVAGAYVEERTLHQRFAEFRTHGEWFKAAPAILAFIEETPTRIDRPNDPQHWCDACNACGTTGGEFGAHEAVAVRWRDDGLASLHECPRGHTWACQWGLNFFLYEDCRCAWCSSRLPAGIG